MSSAIRRNRTGFTLIEMLIVVVVIGILASVAVARFNRVKQRGQMAAVQSDLRNISVAQEGYHMENMTYTNDPDAQLAAAARSRLGVVRRLRRHTSRPPLVPAR